MLCIDCCFPLSRRLKGVVEVKNLDLDFFIGQKKVQDFVAEDSAKQGQPEVYKNSLLVRRNYIHVCTS